MLIKSGAGFSEACASFSKGEAHLAQPAQFSGDGGTKLPSAHGIAFWASDPKLGPRVPKTAKAVASDKSKQFYFQINSSRLAADVPSAGSGGGAGGRFSTLVKCRQCIEPQGSRCPTSVAGP